MQTKHLEKASPTREVSLGMASSDQISAGKWTHLKSFIDRLFRIDEHPSSWAVYEFCTIVRANSSTTTDADSANPYDQFNYGEELYGLVKDELGLCLNDWAKVLEVDGHDHDQFIDKYLLLWNRYKEILPILEAVFSYLERFWIERKIEEREHLGIHYVRPLMYQLWSNLILRAGESVFEGYLKQLHCLGKAGKLKVKQVVESFKLLSVPVFVAHKPYTNIKTEVFIFEKSLLPMYCKHLGEMYDVRTAELLASSSVSLEQVKSMYGFWKAELDLAGEVFGTETLPFVKDVLKQHMLEPVCERVYALFEHYLVHEADPLNQLKSIFDLLVIRKSLLKPLGEYFERGLVKRLVLAHPVIPSPDDSPADYFVFFQSLLKLYQEANALLEGAFRSHEHLAKARDAAFKKILLENVSVSENLALWANELLLAAEVNLESLDFVTCLLSHAVHRELFFALYAKLLANRLLSPAPINKDCEERVIASIKSKHGANYSGSLERMLHDIELSTDVSSSFVRREKRARTDYECKYQVLTHGSWPIEQDGTVDLIVPEAFQSVTEPFEAYYKAQHSGRVLKWLPGLSSVEMEVAFGNGQVCTLAVSLIQYLVLSVLYEASGPLDLEAISALTRIERSQLMHVLDAFKTVGLVREDAFHAYLLSSSISSADNVIVLSKASAKDTHSEPPRISSSERSLDYGPLIQAALMRYMKRSQETPLSTLQADVLAELSTRFLPNHEELEKALASLVDREFLRRDPKRRDIIHYVP